MNTISSSSPPFKKPFTEGSSEVKLFVEILEKVEEEEKKKKDELQEVDELPLEVNTPLQKPIEIYASPNNLNTEELTEAPFQSVFTINNAQVSTSSIKLTPEMAKPIITHIVEATTETIIKEHKSTHFVIQTKQFAEVEIVIDRFSTAPSSYHIEIRGNALLQKMVIQYKETLNQALQRALPSHECLILPPVFPTKERKLAIRKKGIEKSRIFRYGAKEGEIKGHATK